MSDEDPFDVMQRFLTRVDTFEDRVIDLEVRMVEIERSQEGKPCDIGHEYSGKAFGEIVTNFSEVLLVMIKKLDDVIQRQDEMCDLLFQREETPPD